VLNWIEQERRVEVEYFCPPSSRRKTESVHARFVKFFDNAQTVVTPELLAHAEYTSTKKYTVSHFVDLKKEGSAFFIRVRWMDYDEDDDTWEPLVQLCKDVPDMVVDFTKNLPDRVRSLRTEVEKVPIVRALFKKRGECQHDEHAGCQFVTRSSWRLGLSY